MTWNEAFDAFLATHRGSTATQYRIALEDFRSRQSTRSITGFGNK